MSTYTDTPKLNRTTSNFPAAELILKNFKLKIFPIKSSKGLTNENPAIFVFYDSTIKLKFQILTYHHSPNISVC